MRVKGENHGFSASAKPPLTIPHRVRSHQLRSTQKIEKCDEWIHFKLLNLRFYEHALP